ncbi:MAG: SctF chaperone SctG [Parachlamydiales bacterium]|nr:SctF chaperone SctG [Parachlamydiales bacterium]
MNNQEDQNTQDFPLFIEGGFIAIKQGDEDAAKKLFSAAQSLRPDNTAPMIGFGHIALNKNEIATASSYFQKVLKLEPENAVAKVLLGFCLLFPKLGLKKRKDVKLEPQEMDQMAAGGKKLIEEGIKSTEDPIVLNLGKSTLELLDKVAKYQSTPMKN